MYDWTDDLLVSLRYTYPTLTHYFESLLDEGRVEDLMDFLMALETDSGVH